MAELEREQMQGYGASSGMYSQVASIIERRLDTERELDKIEAFLRGTKIVGYQEEGGKIIPVFATMGRQKANDEGIQSIMSWLTPHFSAMTVQGNFDRDGFDYFIFDFHTNFAAYLITNLENWQVSEDEYNGIVSLIVSIAIAFFSRLVDNKERESYSQTFKTVESNVMQKSGGMSLFKRDG